MYYRIHQDNFNREQAHIHLDMLVDHLIDIFKIIYEKYPRLLPISISYRVFLLATSLLCFEMLSVFGPDEIGLDPFELIKTKGCLFFMMYVGPKNFATNLLHAWKLRHHSTHTNT